ncbi:MAG TPA: caspase family protein [Paracoccus sp. (in: a-proteobacteria)]|nr:caspase family protein [Paracoccus sp. (in: a-proteobacteria)]
MTNGCGSSGKNGKTSAPFGRTLRTQVLALRTREQEKTSWRSPLFAAIATAALAGLINAGIAWHNARQQIALEDRKAEAARILEMIKIGGDGESVRNNFQFLLDARLIKNPLLRTDLANFLAETPNARLPRLPSVIAPGGAMGRQLFVLAVSINKYGLVSLNSAAADARAMTRSVSNQRGALYTEVHAQTLLDGEATREAVLSAVDSLGRRAFAVRGDVVIVHFSGHAAAHEGQIYLIPVDGLSVDGGPDLDSMSNAISLPELRERLLPLVGSTYVILLIDACPAAPQSMLEPLGALGMTVAVGGGPGMVCYEPPELNHGAFTAALLRGISGKADANADGMIAVAELLDFGKDEVPRITNGAQVPESVLGFDGPILTVDAAADDTVGAPPTSAPQPSANNLKMSQDHADAAPGD